MKDKTQKCISSQRPEKSHPLPIPKRTFYVRDTFLLFFFFVCLGFYRYWDFLICFWGVFLGGKFLKMEASSKPPHPTPPNFFAFFFKKKKNEKRTKKKKKTKPCCLSVPKPFHQES